MKKLLQTASAAVIAASVSIGIQQEAYAKTTPTNDNNNPTTTNTPPEALPPAIQNLPPNIQQMFLRGQQIYRKQQAEARKNSRPEFDRALRFYAGILRTFDRRHFYGQTEAKHSDLADAALQEMLQTVTPILLERNLITKDDVKTNDKGDITSVKLGDDVLNVMPAPDALNTPHKRETKKRRYYEVQGSFLKPYIEQLNTFSNISKTRLLEHAVNGPIKLTRDKHSGYSNSEERKEMEERDKGELSGIGIHINKDKKGAFVPKVLNNGPAQAAGMKEADIITHINGQNAKDFSLKKIVSLIKGKTGTKVKLTIERAGQNAPIQMEVNRNVVKFPSYTTKMLRDQTGRIHGMVVKIDTFMNRNLAPDFIGKLGAQIMKLRSQRDMHTGQQRHPVNFLALDVRDNGGGLLDAVNFMLTKLIRDNSGNDTVIVSTGRNANENKRTPANTLANAFSMFKIAVFQNGRSASASEILSGSLKDNKIARVYGTRSYGKGSVQSIIPNKNPHGLVRITTEAFFPAGGKSNQCSGVIPDVKVIYGDDRDKLGEEIAKRSCEGEIKIPKEQSRAGEKPKQICSLKAEFSGAMSKETMKKIPKVDQGYFVNSKYEQNPETKNWEKKHYFDADIACFGLDSGIVPFNKYVDLSPYDTNTSQQTPPTAQDGHKPTAVIK